MSLSKFFAALSTPSIERNRLVKHLEEAFRKMEHLTLKAVQLEEEPFKNEELYQAIDKALGGNYGPNKYRGNPHQFIRMTVQHLLGEQKELVRKIEDTFNKTIEVDALSYEKAHLIQYVSAVIWFNEYVLRYTYGLTGDVVKDVYRKRGTIDEYKEFCLDRDNLKTFAIVTNAMNYKAKELSSALSGLKDISFDPETHDAIARIRKGSIDPLGMNMIPGLGHIALIIGELTNSGIEWGYRLAESQAQAAEFQVLYYERQKAGASAEELKEIEKKILFYRKEVARWESMMETLKGE